jgi:hypothetical protein
LRIVKIPHHALGVGVVGIADQIGLPQKHRCQNIEMKSVTSLAALGLMDVGNAQFVSGFHSD